MALEDYLFDIKYESVQELAKSNPEVNNVLVGIKTEMYFTTADPDQMKFQFIYLRYKSNFCGHLLQLKWKQDEFYPLILEFVYVMARKYDLFKPMDIYNAYLYHIRTMLETSLGHTVTPREINYMNERYPNGTLISPFGIETIPFMDNKEFYRHLLNIKDSLPYVTEEKYVYIMMNSRTGYFKIGRSKDPLKREKTLQSEEPDIMLLHHWKAEPAQERELHKKFVSKRVRGEWFKLTIDDLYQLKEIAKF